MLKRSVTESIASAWRALGLPPVPVEVRPAERAEFGDFTTNVALVGAKQAGLPPRALGERLASSLDRSLFSRVDVAGPGFVNVFLEPRVVRDALRAILADERRIGRSDVGQRKRLQVEFVSSNPTGPLTVGHGRQAVLGDVVSSLYGLAGFDVTREYYFNDEGRQVDLLAESLWARYRQALGHDAAIPEEGYQGDYLVEMGRTIAAQEGPRFEALDPAAKAFFREAAVSRIRAWIEEDLKAIGVAFDVFTSEGDLHRAGKVARALDALRVRGGAYEKDGAIWLAAEAHGGTKDSVLVRSDGRPTYLLVDIAYHIDKYERGFDLVLDIQGSDHQTEQSSMKAAMRVLGYPEEFLRYGVHQFVSLKEDGAVARMSTRAGRFVLLGDLLSELGRDVVRFFLVARKPEAHLEFDLDLARAQSQDNPAYYIQYAHTRIASVLRKAPDVGIPWAKVDLAPLTSPAELSLVKELDRFPELVQEAALGFAPHLVAEYALGLARSFHGYYADHRILGEEEKVTAARLALLRALQATFRRSLDVLGLSSPEAM